MPMPIQLLNDIIVIFLISIIAIFAGHRLRIPVVVGFLATGVVAGPHGLRLVQEVEQIEVLAEVGVVLLLFAIGIEFSFDKLLRIKRPTLVGGPLQVAITFLATAFIGVEVGLPLNESILAGFLVALSSTAVVLKILQERDEVDSPHGGTALGMLIFQDIAVVPMMLFVPLLAAEESTGLTMPLLLMLAKGAGIIMLVILGAKLIVPALLYQVVRLRSSELFLLAVILICLSVAWLSYSAGLSLALGAFLAGLIISESEYSYQALGNIIPFRDVFTSFFFVSIGMLLDVGFFIERAELVFAAALGVLVLKAVIAGGVSVLLGYPARTGVLAGLALAQIGEFSFILSKTGLDSGILGRSEYQLFLAVSVLTMAATPFVIAGSPKAADLLYRLPLPEKLKAGHPFAAIPEKRENHLVIIGYGFVGRTLARAARVGELSYLILEMNPEKVRGERANGEPIHYGDATQEMILRHADVDAARVVVVAVSDVMATRRIVEMVRKINPKVYIMARVRYLDEAAACYDLGADEVIPEEFETSVEIFSRVLSKYLVPRIEIDKMIVEVRSLGYDMFRNAEIEPGKISDLRRYLPNVEVVTVKVEEKAPAVGKTLADLELRKKLGVNALGILRDSGNILNPTSETEIEAGDVLLVLGTSEQISKSRHLFRDPVRYPRAGAGALKDRDGSEDEKDGEKPSEGAEETPDRIDD
ncbi:MAG: cation:proton antiporter [Methanothrix sp.]|uniref:Sodium/hydrogen exchanger n=1 Tax=Methanothrix harundinacea TaxID=301375 RepID=A0A124FMK4_9EURY|nr:MAG: Sodium/hydrogen exchanger [Methanothrix harundinacea]